MTEYSLGKNLEQNSWLQQYTVSDLCLCIIRQFFLKHNLESTLSTFQKESKIPHKKIAKSILVKVLSMNNLVYFNQQTQKPYSSLLEVLVNYLRNKFECKINNEQKIDETSRTQTKNQEPIQKQQTKNVQTLVEQKRSTTAPLVNKQSNQNTIHEKVLVPSVIPKEKNNSLPENIIPEKQKIDHQIQMPNAQQEPIREKQKQDIKKNNQKKQSSSRTGGMRKFAKSRQSNTEKSLSQFQQEISKTEKEEKIQQKNNVIEKKDQITLKSKTEKNTVIQNQKQGDNEPKMVKMFGKKRKIAEESQEHATKFKFDENFVDQPLGGKIEKYEYEEFSLNKVKLKEEPGQNTINYSQKITGNSLTKKKTDKPMSSQQVALLKKVIFQNNPAILPKSWNQGFILSPYPNTPYGLKQIEGGPCGIIAAIQCFFLKHLLYLSNPESENCIKNQILRENCLVASFADILYKVKSTEKVFLVTPPASFSGNKIDYENLKINTIQATSFQKVYEGIFAYKQYFIGKSNHGVAFLLFSIVMTKGPELIWKQIDSKENPLIGNHGHCTQQLVNLFISGKASSNCFDGDKIIDEEMKLKGITEKSEFGFLTIFETLKYVEVGKNLKNPIYPFWIICKQFHYHVIFGTHYLIGENNDAEKFDLIYFDGLYNCEDHIRLTLEAYGYEEQPNKKIKNLPLIQQVLMTKWGERKVDWNGSVKIL